MNAPELPLRHLEPPETPAQALREIARRVGRINRTAESAEALLTELQGLELSRAEVFDVLDHFAEEAQRIASLLKTGPLAALVAAEGGEA